MLALQRASAAVKCMLRFAPTVGRRNFGGFDFQRKEYEKRGGLRTVEDLREEQKERAEGFNEEQEFQRKTFFGRKRKKSLRETLYYTDRTGGKGYSDYASGLYTNRPYMWPPLRRIYSKGIYVLVIFLFFALVDTEWVAFHIERIYKERRDQKRSTRPD